MVEPCASTDENEGQSRAVLSSDAVSTRAPSGENTAEVTDPHGRAGLQLLAGGGVPEPGGVVIGRGEHARAVGRERPRRPSSRGRAGPAAPGRGGVPQPRGVVLGRGEHARAVGREHGRVTRPSWPRRTRSSWPEAASHSRAVLSADAVSTRAPSGENTAEVTGSSWPRRTRAPGPRRRPTAGRCCQRTR